MLELFCSRALIFMLGVLADPACLPCRCLCRMLGRAGAGHVEPALLQSGKMTLRKEMKNDGYIN